MLFCANRFGVYTSDRYAIRLVTERKRRYWRATRGRHFIGDFRGDEGLRAAQKACAKYAIDNEKAVAMYMRRRK